MLANTRDLDGQTKETLKILHFGKKAATHNALAFPMEDSLVGI
jgi:hypothetical protein